MIEEREKLNPAAQSGERSALCGISFSIRPLSRKILSSPKLGDLNSTMLSPIEQPKCTIPFRNQQGWPTFIANLIGQRISARVTSQNRFHHLASAPHLFRLFEPVTQVTVPTLSKSHVAVGLQEIFFTLLVDQQDCVFTDHHVVYLPQGLSNVSCPAWACRISAWNSNNTYLRSTICYQNQ